MNTKIAFKSQEGRKDILNSYQSLMKSWYSPNEQFYVNTKFGSTYIIASGDKDASPMILLHGSAMNSAMWLKDVLEYSLHFRVYAVDIPGEPGRSDEHQIPFEGSDFSDWLNDVLHALSVERAILIGNSLGAWLSIKYAVNPPDKVVKLVLLSPAGIGSQNKLFPFISLGRMLRGEKGVEKILTKINGNQPVHEVILKYQKLIGKHFNYRREMIPLFSNEEIRRLSMPTMLLVGANDIMIHSEQSVKRLKELCPTAVIHLYPDAGHVLINLTDNIAKFLNL